MIAKRFLPGLLNTDPVCDRLVAIRDGLVNFYVVKAPAGLVCIDTGWRATRVLRALEALELNVRDVAAVFLTHLHWDHARCWGLYPEARVFVGEREVPSRFVEREKPSRPWETVRDGQAVTVAGLPVQAIDTPGHTAGSVSYIVDTRLLFTGDTLRLRRGEVLPFMSCFNLDDTALARSIQRLAGIGGIERLLTAHSGTTCDLAQAFFRWRERAADGPRRIGDGA